VVKIGSTGHGRAGVLPAPMAPRSTPFCHPWMRLVSALAAASIDREGVSAKWPPVQVKSRVASLDCAIRGSVVAGATFGLASFRVDVIMSCYICQSVMGT
jgi:hypothetical protein